jgi:AcrR family transcriptional regulator
MTDTRQKLLDAAERLFGERGYDATSLRHIIADAGVNLAAVHYHFGSKEELLDGVVLRKAGPVNQTRLALLDRLEAEAEHHPPAVEKVLDAFLGPMAESAERNPQFVRLMGRLHSEGLMPGILRKHFQPVLGRFRAALRRGLPGLPEQELLWRIHFMIGAMAHTMCGPPGFPRAAAGDARSRIARLVVFLSAGFRAPSPKLRRSR